MQNGFPYFYNPPYFVLGVQTYMENISTHVVGGPIGRVVHAQTQGLGTHIGVREHLN